MLAGGRNASSLPWHSVRDVTEVLADAGGPRLRTTAWPLLWRRGRNREGRGSETREIHRDVAPAPLDARPASADLRGAAGARELHAHRPGLRPTQLGDQAPRP